MFTHNDRWNGFHVGYTGEAPKTFWDRSIANARTPVGQGFWKGLSAGGEGSLIGLPMIAFEAGTAQRGEIIPTLFVRTVGLVTYPAMTGLIAAALSLPFGPFKGIGIAASLLGMYPDSMFQDKLMRGVSTVTTAGKRLRHLETGGSYQDTEVAYNQRMSSINEMSGAMQTSRRYLGQEAALLHQ